MANPNTTTNSNAGTTIAIIAVILIAVIAGAYFMDASKHNEKLNTAVEEFKDNANHGRVLTGIREGSEDLRDRTTGEKVGDAIGDAGRNLQDAAHDNDSSKD